MKHIGIAAVTAEGAAITYKYICSASEQVFGKHTHPEISIHGFSFSEHVNFGPERLRKWQDLLVRSINKLEATGAQLVICPSNTPHEVYEQVCEKINIPWLNIADEVAKVAEQKQYKKILLLGTQFTFNSAVYPNAFEHLAAEIVIPTDEEQVLVHSMIVDELVSGVVSESARQAMQSLLSKFAQQGVDSVILGCTELPLIIDEALTQLAILDSTQILGDAAIKAATN